MRLPQHLLSTPGYDQLPMMECKKALSRLSDIEKAVDILRTMGVAKAVKRAGRDTSEGTIATLSSSAQTASTGATLELSWRLDFAGTWTSVHGCWRSNVLFESNPVDVEESRLLSLATRLSTRQLPIRSNMAEHAFSFPAR